MSARRHDSLEELLKTVSRDELARIIARRGRIGREEFLAALHADLDEAIERLEGVAHHYAADGPEKLTGFLAAQLAAAGYHTSCKEDAPGCTELKIENRAAMVVWVAKANLHDHCERSIGGILQLLGCTSGRHAHAGFLLYIREGAAVQIIEDWITALRNDKRMACRAVQTGETACLFTSDHAHPSGFQISVRHHAVLLDRAQLRNLTKKQVILFLGADPDGTRHPSLVEEVRTIQMALERSSLRDCFELKTRLGAEPLDLLHELRKLKPAVVHYSGLTGPEGLSFQGTNGHARVSTEALQDAFGAVEGVVKLVVLSTGYSDEQAEALLPHVGCVVGVNGTMESAAARSFAFGLYGGLGEGASITTAYKQGRAAIRLESLPDADCPRLKVREGVDADHLVLAAEPR